MRALAALHDDPGAPIPASLVIQLPAIGITAVPLLDVLSAAGLLHDDRPPALAGWIDRQIRGLPEPMTTEVRTWFEVLRDGSPTPPRARPRTVTTVRLRVHYAIPALKTWASDGHHSLREITRDHVLAVLPATGSPRALTGASLRSLFTTLKARKLIYHNPIARIRTGRPETREPRPADLDALTEALTGTHPARAAITALIAFHGLRPGQVRALQLTDIRDGRLHLPGRVVPLPDPVRQRLSDWLDERRRRWPDTTNPHVFINIQTAGRTTPVSAHWIWATLKISGQAIREDRILDEAQASGGDIRRLCDLFGLSVKGAQRYVDTLDTHSSRTHDPQ
jgi:integrase